MGQGAKPLEQAPMALEIGPEHFGDGTGYGLDGTVWGGEFFVVTETGWERVAHFRCFPLPGGERAVKEPRRTALGLLFEMLGEAVVEQEDLAPVRAFSRAELAPLKTMPARRLNSPLTSSAGRLFDAVASLTGLCQRVRFEGQAAMELEFALDGVQTDETYPFSIGSPPPPAPPNSPLSAGPRAPDLALPCVYPIYPLTASVLRSRSRSESRRRAHPVSYYGGLASVYFVFGRRRCAQPCAMVMPRSWRSMARAARA